MGFPFGGWIGVASLVVAVSFAIWVASFASGSSLFTVAVIGWVVAPYFLLWLTSLAVKTVAARGIIAVAVVVTAGFGVWAFDAVSRDPQGALVLLFGPAYQIAGGVVAVLIAASVEWFTIRAGRNCVKQTSS